jgi:pseudouridine synthase
MLQLCTNRAHNETPTKKPGNRVDIYLFLQYLITNMSYKQGPVKLWTIVQQQSGVSRRKAQRLITSGEVELNEKITVDPFSSVVTGEVRTLRLRGHPLSLAPVRTRVYRYNKQPGVLCSHDDPHCGNTLGRILRFEGFIGYTCAGRLDQDAEGLVLITNDGQIVQRLTHPSFRVRKVYNAWLKEFPHQEKMRKIYEQMHKGITDNGELLQVIAARTTGNPPYAVITLAEGHKHEVKRLFEHFGLRVVRLQRVSLGPVELGKLKPGNVVRLTEGEEHRLRSFLEHLSHKRPGQKGKPPL